MKVLLIIGHNPKSKGAYNSQLKLSEFDFWYDYVESQVLRWHQESGHELTIITRPAGKGYHAEMRHVHDFGSKWGADCSVEFHWNGFHNKSVHGHETLYYRGSIKGKKIASQMDKQFDKYLDNNDRNLKPVGGVENGAYGLFVGRYPSILTEPFFNYEAHKYVEGGSERENMNKAYAEFFKSLHI